MGIMKRTQGQQERGEEWNQIASEGLFLCFVMWAFLFKIEFILLFYLVPLPAGRIKESDKMSTKERNRIELGAISSFLLSEQIESAIYLAEANWKVVSSFSSS